METTTKDPKLAALLKETDAVIQEAKDFLQANGKTYDLSTWITIKEYAKRHNLESTNVVSNWINRGIITPEDIRDFPDLNNLRLIRDKQYK